MKQNDKTLSTRDLVSPTDPADGGVTTSDPDVQHEPGVAAAQPGEVFDRAGPEGDQIGLPADEQTQTPAVEETRPRGEQTGAGHPAARAAEHTTLAFEEPMSAQTGDRTASEADRDADGFAPGVPGREGETGPTESTDAVSSQDQNTDAADPAAITRTTASDAGSSLLPAETDATFQQRWKEIQTRFVDEPRGAVEDADTLVANLMQQLAEGFA
ncbi:MAG: hypothetical protein ACR2NR_06710, partial [Solirubrobacteraceae bacterium]